MRGVEVGVGLHGGGIFWFRSDILADSIGRGAEMQAPAGKSRKHKTVSSKSAPQFEVSLFKRLGVVAMDGERAAGAKPRREGRLRGFGTSGHHASPTRHMRASATALREATRGQKSEELVLNTSGASDMDFDVTLGSTRPDRLYAVWPQQSRPRTLPVVVLSVTSPWASLAFSSKRWLRGWKTMQSCTRSVPSRVASVTKRREEVTWRSQAADTKGSKIYLDCVALHCQLLPHAGSEKKGQECLPIYRLRGEKKAERLALQVASKGVAEHFKHAFDHAKVLNKSARRGC